MASSSRRIYVGVTNNLPRRVAMHRAGEVEHTRHYREVRLVYADSTNNIDAAIRREKQIKGWLRSRKIALIQSLNPGWDDLAEDWEGDDVLR